MDGVGGGGKTPNYVEKYFKLSWNMYKIGLDNSKKLKS